MVSVSLFSHFLLHIFLHLVPSPCPWSPQCCSVDIFIF
jgi:hypothetical protein